MQYLHEWFNQFNPVHLVAYDIWLKTGSWPNGFIPKDVIDFPGSDAYIVKKLAGAYMTEQLEKINTTAEHCLALRGYDCTMYSIPYSLFDKFKVMKMQVDQETYMTTKYYEKAAEFDVVFARYKVTRTTKTQHAEAAEGN